MTTSTDSLIGAVVVQIETLHDYVQIHFNGGRILTIFNVIEAEGELPRLLHDLVGRQLSIAKEQNGMFLLGFDNDATLKVKMTDDAFRGPEAMHLICPGQPMIVW